MLKDAALETTSFDSLSDAVRGAFVADSSPVGYEPATSVDGASHAPQVQATRVPQREVIERLITELELAREFFALNTIKSAPRQISRGSVSSTAVLKDADLETTSFDSLSDAVQDAFVADSSPVGYEPATSAVGASHALQVEATRIPQRELIERLITELELAREFFALNTIKSAPRPIPRGSVSSAAALKDAALGTTSFDSLSDAVRGASVADSSPVSYESETSEVGASHSPQIEASRVPQREVIERLITELELAHEFLSLNTIKSAPRPQRSSVSNAVVS
jgi:hypothetical protein